MRLLWLALALSALTAALAGVSGARTTHSSRLRGQNFYSNCYFSHISADDPIVYPNQPGVSHSHTFFGSKTTSATSTLKTLLASATTCRRTADTAAYWVPTLYSNGEVVKPTKGSAYFVLRGREMHAFPSGLKIVAGNAHARSPQNLRVTYWSCTLQERTRWAVPQSCKATPRRSIERIGRKSLLQFNVVFPDCWDGRHLDSPDHKSHMAYSHNWTCPPSHPVKVPRLRFIVTYPIQVPRGLLLASGGLYSGHADYFNAWHEDALRRLVADCFDYRPRCNSPAK